MKIQPKLIGFTVIVLLGAGVALTLQRKAPAVAAPPTNAGPKAREVSTPAASVQGNSAAASATSSGRPFARMTIQERSAALDEIKKQDILTLFRTWVECSRTEHDSLKQMLVGALLAQALRGNGANKEIFQQMKAFIDSETNSVGDRTQLLWVLGQAASLESVSLLLSAAIELSDKSLAQAARREIRAAGSERWAARFHEELSPELEQAWKNATDQDLQLSVAIALAEIGASNGVNLLLSSAVTPQSSNDFRAMAARRALAEVRNPSAVSVLAEFLRNQPTNNPDTALASATLAGMIDESAAISLVNWFQTADESTAPLAQAYVLRTRTDVMLRAWESTLDPKVPFRSEKNREAIRAGLAEYQQSRKPSS